MLIKLILKCLLSYHMMGIIYIQLHLVNRIIETFRILFDLIDNILMIVLYVLCYFIWV
jgi:hypothetical protein